MPNVRPARDAAGCLIVLTIDAELPDRTVPTSVRVAESSTLTPLLTVRGLVGIGVAEADQTSAERSPSRPALLVVDDDVEPLVTPRDMLTPTGCRVVTAVDGAGGLARFSQDDFAVLVGIPVIMVTAWDLLLSDEDLDAYGIVTVLTKPVTSHSLRQAVRQAIG